MRGHRWFDLGGLEPYQPYAVLPLRLFTAVVLVYGTQDNVFSAERMHEFEVFLAQRGTPVPGLAAPVSVYAQFLCGLLILVGAATRQAGAVMAVNFLAALAIAHRDTPYQANIAPLAMLALSVFFLLHGAGPLSVEAWLAGRRARDVEGAAGA